MADDICYAGSDADQAPLQEARPRCSADDPAAAEGRGSRFANASPRPSNNVRPEMRRLADEVIGVTDSLAATAKRWRRQQLAGEHSRPPPASPRCVERARKPSSGAWLPRPYSTLPPWGRAGPALFPWGKPWLAEIVQLHVAGGMDLVSRPALGPAGSPAGLGDNGLAAIGRRRRGETQEAQQGLSSLASAFSSQQNQSPAIRRCSGLSGFG